MAAADPNAASDLQEDWNPRSPAILEDQLRVYDRMRGSCPVAHSEKLGWPVFRHADVVAIAEDEMSCSSRVSAAHPAVPNGFDPPRHGAYRRVVERYFDPEEVAGFEPLFQAIACELTEALPHDDEIVSILRNWTVGELGTMSANACILVDYLAKHPELQRQLRHLPDSN